MLPAYDYHCVLPESILVFSTIYMVQDFLVLAIPIPIVWQLQLPKKQRVATIILFSLSFFVCIAAVFRTFYSTGWAVSYDESWVTWELGIATVVELNLAVVRPAPLFVVVLPGTPD